MFLVGAFLVKRARLLQWLVFLLLVRLFSSDHRPHRVCTIFTDFTRSRVLVSTFFTRFTMNPAVTGSSPCFSQKLFRAIFFGTVRLSHFFRSSATFFAIFLTIKGSHLQVFFEILQQTKVPKSPKRLHFYVIRHNETVQNFHFSFCFENWKKIEIFLHLQRIPPSIIWYFATD